MILFIVLIIATILFLGSLCDWEIPAIIFGLMLGVVLFLPVNAFISVLAGTEYQVKETIPIHAMQNSAGYKGNFFLGCGSVKNEPVYYFLTKDDNGEIKLFDVNAKKSTITEYSGSPKVEISEKYFTSRFWQVVACIPMANNKYKFYVPKGSVNYSFSIDLANF